MCANVHRIQTELKTCKYQYARKYAIKIVLIFRFTALAHRQKKKKRLDGRDKKNKDGRARRALTVIRYSANHGDQRLWLARAGKVKRQAFFQVFLLRSEFTASHAGSPVFVSAEHAMSRPAPLSAFSSASSP